MRNRVRATPQPSPTPANSSAEPADQSTPERDPVENSDEFKSKLTLGVYVTPGARVYDLNLRHQFGSSFTGWVAGFYDPKGSRLMRLAGSTITKRDGCIWFRVWRSRLLKQCQDRFSLRTGQRQDDFFGRRVANQSATPSSISFGTRVTQCNWGLPTGSAAMIASRHSRSLMCACILSSKTLTCSGVTSSIATMALPWTGFLNPVTPNLANSFIESVWASTTTGPNGFGSSITIRA